jgi:hypothetical protein
MQEYSSMAQQLHHPATEFYFVVILLLLSYVMSSAPRYVRDWRDNPGKTGPGIEKNGDYWKKVVAAYTIQPYTNAWQTLMSPGQNKGIAAR